MAGWASLDNPWIHMVKPSNFGKSLESIRRLAPKMILSAHLPPAPKKTDQFLKLLATIPSATPSIAPNQQALEQILAQAGERG
jgi:hypothetical protein